MSVHAGSSELELGLENRTLAAHHEAGHAVVAVLLGMPVDVVTIGADGSGSRCRIRPRGRNLRQILAYAATHLGGGLAEERLMAPLGMRWEGPSILPGGFDDEAHFRAWIRRIRMLHGADQSRSREDRIFRGMVRRVRRLLARDETWRAVRAVAEQLLRKGELGGAEVRAIVALPPSAG